MAAATRILEVGCGTGAVLEELPVQAGAAIHALDLNQPSVKQASVNAPGILPLCSDGSFLPYPRACFDLTFCHYLLLWARDPGRILREMVRVTRPGGAVLALAEPDYGGRVDYPLELAELGHWQAESLKSQGADPLLGRKLAGLFVSAGLRDVETGVMGGEWRHPSLPGEREMEWDVLESDLAGKIPASDIQRMKALDFQAARSGARVLFVPTFFAWGRV
jgi:SAM-dependent methyltransferase